MQRRARLRINDDTADDPRFLALGQRHHDREHSAGMGDHQRMSTRTLSTDMPPQTPRAPAISPRTLPASPKAPSKKDEADLSIAITYRTKRRVDVNELLKKSMEVSGLKA